MLRMFAIYLLLCLLVVVLAPYGHFLIVYIDMLFAYLNVILKPVFSYIGMHYILQKTLLLAVIPAIIAGIPALLYRMVRGKTMPHFYTVMWVVWFVVVMSNILIH